MQQQNWGEDDEEQSHLSRSGASSRSNDHGSRSSTDDNGDHHFATTEQVLHRIEHLVCSIVQALDEERLPVLETFCPKNDRRNIDSDDDDDSVDQATGTRTIRKDFSLQQARSLTSIVLVLDYCYQLLLQHKTTTVREVYYAYVTHFRNQNECDIAIRDAAVLLHVPRHALGLQASAKGWFCGDVQIVRRRKSRKPNNHCNDSDDDDDESESEANNVLLDGRQLLHSVHGSIIGSEWLESPQRRNFTLETEAAHCILVVEKEGIYRRLAQDRFFDNWPCILVTGKGFPDLATRAFVHALHTTLQLPVWGLADGNPYGVLVLHTYARGSMKRGLDGGDRYSVPIQWVGLRASQMQVLLSTTTLPPAVVQPLAPLDIQRLTKTLLNEQGHGWLDTPDEQINEARCEELEDLLEGGTKMELEALHWLGVEYLGQWLGNIFEYNLRERHDEDSDDDDRMAHFEIL